MEYALLGSYLVALLIYAFARPSWRNIGPSLTDAFVLGILLFAAGSIAGWMEQLPNAEAVMWIGVAAGLSGTLAASLWSYIFRSRIAELRFFEAARNFNSGRGDRFAITVGLAISILVCLCFVVAVFSHQHIRSLLLAALLHGSATFAEARVIISSGSEGYFAPGYVKQFRDIMIPILCTAAILCRGSYRYQSLVYGAIAIAIVSILISGQRSVVVQFVLCLGLAFLIELDPPRRSTFAWIKIAVPVVLVMVVLVGAMTQMLGRLDAAISPPIQRTEVEKQTLRLKLMEEAKSGLEAIASQKRTREQHHGGGSSDPPQQRAEVEALQSRLAQLERGDMPAAATSETLASSGLPRPLLWVISLAYRAVIAVPRENAISYASWANRSPAMGGGWMIDLAGIRPGTQKQLSNELSEAIKFGDSGNSPLGLATDVYYNWGWPGIAIVPAVFALVFLVLDILLVEGRSPLLFGGKIFAFFSVPLMYSPFLFILYGGAAVALLLIYVWLLRRQAFAFIGLRE